MGNLAKGPSSRALICALFIGLATALAGPIAADDGADAAKIADLVGKLRDSDAEVRGTAADGLAAMGAAAVPALVAVVQDAASPARRDAATVLGRIGGDALPAIGPLTSLASDAKAKAQAEAAMAIGRIAVGAAKSGELKAMTQSPAEKAVQAGLDWLARHQEADGHWSSGKYTDRCAEKPPCAGVGQPEYDVGLTGLALAAFLGAGSTHAKGPYAEKVELGLRWLRGQQDAGGLIGGRKSQHFNYNHACATLALVEDYRRTGARVLAEPAARAVAFVHLARNPAAGWRYEVPPDGLSDTSVTVWMAKVLDVASAAGLEVDPAAMNGALSWVDSVTDEKTGRTGYLANTKGGAPARTNEMIKLFPSDQSESLTAAALVVRLSVGRTRESDPFIALGETLLVAKPPVWDVRRGSTDLYYWMHGAEALHRLGGPAWDVWKKAVTDLLLVGQRGPASGCARGSWDPSDPWCPDGGRLWMTTAALLALEHAADDPARRPAMSPAIRASTWALEKLMKSPDAAVRRTAQRALDSIRGSYR